VLPAGRPGRFSNAVSAAGSALDPLPSHNLALAVDQRPIVMSLGLVDATRQRHTCLASIPMRE
jgi:hypothetical protein